MERDRDVTRTHTQAQNHVIAGHDVGRWRIGAHRDNQDLITARCYRPLLAPVGKRVAGHPSPHPGGAEIVVLGVVNGVEIRRRGF